MYSISGASILNVSQSWYYSETNEPG